MKVRLLILFLMLSNYLPAQDANFHFGARHLGLAGSSITISDEYSLFNNIGGLGRVKHHALFGGYQNRYGIPEFQVIGGGAIFQSAIGNMGIGYSKFGDDHYSQQQLLIGFGNTIQMISLGLSLGIQQYHLASIGTQHVFILQFGGIVELTPQLFLGAHVFNLTQTKLIEETGEKLPSIMKGGLSFRPTNEVMLNVEVEKNLGFKETYHLGLEYQIVTHVFIRTGIQHGPFQGTFGLGFHPKRMKLDYGFATQNQIGNVHECSISYSLK